MSKNKPGMLVTLQVLVGDEVEMMTINQDDCMAYHHEISCMTLNDACVRLVFGVNQRNIVEILRHEELHHVFEQINEVDADLYLDDYLLDDDGSCCRLLGCTNHQLGAGR